MGFLSHILFRPEPDEPRAQVPGAPLPVSWRPEIPEASRTWIAGLLSYGHEHMEAATESADYMDKLLTVGDWPAYLAYPNQLPEAGRTPGELAGERVEEADEQNLGYEPTASQFAELLRQLADPAQPLHILWWNGFSGFSNDSGSTLVHYEETPRPFQTAAERAALKAELAAFEQMSHDCLLPGEFRHSPTLDIPSGSHAYRNYLMVTIEPSAKADDSRGSAAEQLIGEIERRQAPIPQVVFDPSHTWVMGTELDYGFSLVGSTSEILSSLSASFPTYLLAPRDDIPQDLMFS